MSARGDEVYCTLLTSDFYLPGAIILAHSLRDAGTAKDLAVLVTLDSLSQDTVSALENIYDYVIPVDRIASSKLSNLQLMDRPDLVNTFTKIALWKQTQFKKIVYVDADIVALRAPDELFDLDVALAAAPDVGWPDAFNTGLLVLKPDMGRYWALQTLASSGVSFDGADQGLLNEYFQDRRWKRISFTYNCTPSAQYQWEPAYKHYKSSISMVHFIGKEKPWSHRPTGEQGSGVYDELLARWWAVYDIHMREHGNEQEPSVSRGSRPGQRRRYQADTSSLQANEPFEAPIMQWDATRSAPPAKSEPEAAAFLAEVYSFSSDTDLFRPQAIHRGPSTDTHHEPSQDKPKSIFPWEERAPPPSRIFAEDLLTDSEADEASQFEGEPEDSIEGSQSERSEERAISEGEPRLGGEASAEGEEANRSQSPSAREYKAWQSFVRTSNVWDAVPGIGNYVRSIKDAQDKRKAPSLSLKISAEARSGGWASHPHDLVGNMSKSLRRESLILTEFPSELDRPSLPVTPAPIQRMVFWDEEAGDRSGAGLPLAEGVPDQVDWVCPSCGFTVPAERFTLAFRSGSPSSAKKRSSAAASSAVNTSA